MGIYWNDHHHLLHAAHGVNGWILWANLHLLFWLSLFPFATAWVGENPGESGPAAYYGFVLLMASVAYPILERALIAHHGRDSALERALRHNRREWISMTAYAAAIPLAFVNAAGHAHSLRPSACAAGSCPTAASRPSLLVGSRQPEGGKR